MILQAVSLAFVLSLEVSAWPIYAERLRESRLVYTKGLNRRITARKD